MRDRDQWRREFQAGEIDTVIGTLDTISEGLTWSRANTAIRVERSWKPSRNEQFEQRLRELGKTAPCLVLDLVCEGTLDQRMSKVLSAKTDQQMKALPAGRFAELL